MPLLSLMVLTYSFTFQEQLFLDGIVLISYQRLVKVIAFTDSW